MITCKWCGCDGKAAKSHIIPKAFFGFGSDGEDRSRSKILSSKDNTYPKSAPQGVYDQEILCLVCEEKIFAPCDDKAIKFFQKDLEDNYPLNPPFKIYSPSQFDYENLRLFILSVLWRAHHSKHEFYEKVDLGYRNEKALKAILLKHNADDYRQYPIFFRRYNTNRAGARVILHPIYSRQFDSIERNFYVITMAAHQIIIKVDQRNWPAYLDQFILKPDEPLYVGLLDFEKSKPYEAIMEVLEKNRDVRFK